MKLHKLFALLLTLAMVLPMVAAIVPVSAEETVVELPTETVTVPPEVPSVPRTETWDFSDPFQLDYFQLYQSGSNAFTISDGMLMPDGRDGEVKAVLADTPQNIESVSVDILPGESGVIYGGLYFGASDAGNGIDQINSQAILIKSDYDPAGWKDAINRIDIVRGQFNNNWKHISTTISETGNGNALFSGSKQPLNLRLVFSGDILLLQLSLVNNPAKYVQLMYEVDPSIFEGQIGLRAIGSDTRFDNLSVTYAYEGTDVWGFSSKNQFDEFESSVLNVSDGYMNSGVSVVENVPWQTVLKTEFTNVKSVSVEMTPSGNGIFYGGISIGSTQDALLIGTGNRDAGNGSKAELWTHKQPDQGTAFTMESVASDDSFFDGTASAVNLTVQLESDKIIATVTRLDDASKTITLEYACDLSTFNGKIGLMADRSAIQFDNLNISYSYKQTDLHVDRYDFENYTDTNPITNDFTANSKYSLRDVTDETGSTDKHLYAVYGTTSQQTPGAVMLHKKYDTVYSLSVNVYPDVNNTSWKEYYGGVRVGFKDGTYLDFMGGCNIYEKAYRKYGTLGVHKDGNYSTGIYEAADVPGFFKGDYKEPINLKLVFDKWSKTITFTMTHMQTLRQMVLTYPYEPENLSGEFGLATFRRPLSYDDFEVFYQPIDVKEDTYDFEGYDTENPITNDFTANSKYSLRDVTDETGSVDKHLYAVYGTTSQQNPGAVMLLETYESARTVSVNVYPDVKNTSWKEYYGGVRVRFKDGTYLDFMGGCNIYTKAYRKYGTLGVHNGDYLAGIYEAEDVPGFFKGDYKEPINLKLVFDESTGTITFTMTHMQTLRQMVLTYPYEPENLSGEFGLVTFRRPLSYDDFTIAFVENRDTYDFSNLEQQDLFDYYEPYKSGNYIADGKMTVLEMGQVALSNRIENMEAVSVDIYPDTAADNPFAGIYLGDETSGVVFLAGSRPGADPYNAEISVVGKTGFEYDTLGTPIASAEGFFADGVMKPVNLKLEIGSENITATMSLIEDPSVCITGVYAYQADTFSGKIGLTCYNGSEQFDNLTVKATVDAQEKPNFIYVNQGSSLYNDGYWKASEHLSAVPYTVEAWLKVPKGIYDDASGTILTGNIYDGAPYVALRMVPNGGLQLVWAVELEDFSTKTSYYNAAVDIRTGQWTHVAYTCDAVADKVVCYVNGEAVETWENAGLAGMTTANHIFAENEYAIGNDMFGWIADVRMWDRALSADELQVSMMTQYTTAKEGLLLNAPLDALVSDAYVDMSGNGNNLTKYYRATPEMATESHEPGAYSIVVIPDQQILAHYAPQKLNQMYQWIADNREKENIQIVMNVGDMADNCGNITQWEGNRAAWELLPDDLPFITVPGNHDYDTNSGWNKGYGVRSKLTLMNQYFPMSLFENYSTDFGALSRDQGVEDNVANTYQAFEVNGNKYLILALEYVPRDDAVAWANEVVARHPNHQVIMLTHSYLSRRGFLDRPYLWNDFVKQHENIIMTVSGHVTRESIIRRMDKGVNGNVVHSMLFDVQHIGKLAMLGILRFNADGTQCEVSYYSTESNMYETDSNTTLTLPKQEHKYYALVGTDSYTTVSEAIANANGGVVKILQDTDEVITVSSDLTIDLAGCKLSNVTVAEGAKLNLIDSTATYSGTKGSATVTGSVERFVEHDGNKYMVIGENGVYAPHRYYVGITNVSLDPSVIGFGYKARFYGDETVQTQVANVGYDLWLSEDRVVTRTADFKNLLTLRLKNFMVDQYGEAPVNAKAFITLVDGTKLEGAVHSYSMKQMVELINDTCADFTATQLKAAAIMIKESQTMLSWNVANILESLKPSATVEPITVTDQAMTLLDGTSYTLSLNGAYSFTTNETAESLAYSDYADWIADYYITMDKEAGEGLYLAGNYGQYGWIAIPVEAGKTYTNIPVVQTLLAKSLTYTEMVNDVVSFSCGVADTAAANTGATVTVELRLTNPENSEEFIILNTTTLTIA